MQIILQICGGGNERKRGVNSGIEQEGIVKEEEP